MLRARISSLSVLVSGIVLAAPLAFASRPLAERPAYSRSSDALVYHGKILRPTGKPVEGQLEVMVEIYSPEPTKCLLWAESQGIEAVKGAFAVEIGYVTSRRGGVFGGAAPTFREVFLNNPGLNLTNANCAQGNSYSPSPADDRIMKVAFKDGDEIVTMEEIPIKSVPFAKQASEIAGYGINNLFKIGGAGSPSVVFDPSEVENLKTFSGSFLAAEAPLAAGSANQIFGMNAAGDGVEYKSLTGGTNVTITQTPGGIEISSSNSGGTVTSVGVGGAPLSVVNATSSPVISITQANSTQPGFLSSADWNLFNSKQPAGNYLTSINSADVTNALGYTPISNASSGQVVGALGYTPVNQSLPDGMTFIGNASGVATAAWLGIGQIRNNVGAPQFPTSCTASQTLTWSAVTDLLSCTPISINASAVSGLGGLADNNSVDLSGAEATGILAAARFPALTGAVTTTAGAINTVLSANAVGTSNIADNAVTTSKIANSNVSFAKIQNLSTNNLLLGRSTAGAGAIEELTVGSGLLLSSGVLSATNTNTGTVTSIGISVPAFMTSSGGPISSSGTIALGFGSQSAAQVFASPSGASGTPAFRSLAAVDIPSLDAAKITSGTFGTSLIPNLDTSKITTGTLPVARGGTGSGSALANNRVMVSSGGNIVEAAAITANSALISDANGIPIASSTVSSTELGYLDGVTSSIQTQLAGKQATGNYITALTGDVTATGPGSVAATVANVGGVTAANVAAGTNLANAATSANTANAIVRRDGSGGFTAGAIASSSTISANGNIANGGFDFFLGSADQVTRGNSGTSRALVKNATSLLTVNFSGDFTGGTVIEGAGGTDNLYVSAATNGNVGIGTTNPTERLHVVGDILATGEIISTNSNQIRMISGNYGMFFRNDGANTYLLHTASGDQYGSWNTLRPMRVDNVNGDVHLGNGALYVAHGGGVTAGVSMNAPAFNYTSDRRLKTNIHTIESGLDKVLQLRGVTFDWKKTGNHDVGFIAQEVEEVLPDLVIDSKDESGASYKSVRYGNIVAVVVEAIKELWEKFNQSEERIQKLEQENQELKARLKAIEDRLSAQ